MLIESGLGGVVVFERETLRQFRMSALGRVKAALSRGRATGRASLGSVLVALLMGIVWAPGASARHPEHLHCAVHAHEHETERLVLRGCESNDVLAPGQVGANTFLFNHAWEIGLKLDLSDLALVDEQSGLGGVRTRFQQMLLGLPVYESNISVNQSNSGEVQALYSNYYSALTGDTATATVTQAAAEGVAIAAAGIQSTRLPTTAELVFYPLADGTAALAWKLVVFSDAPLGDFLTLVGATSGKLLLQENRIAFDTGSALVYVPNPMQQSGNLGLSDAGDTASTALNNGRVAVTLLGLDPGIGTLKGEYVDLVGLAGGLAVPDADEVSRVYNYDRSDDRFEQATIYHSIDSIQRYFHSLGFDDDTGAVNGIRDFPTLAHAHWNTADQSFYSTGDNAVHFGDGGVDDGEDADVVAHEYGHAVQHDQNSCWGGGEMGAMGEGFGDYLAASFYNDDGNVAYQSANAACVAEWDATSYSPTSPPCLRRVDGTKTHPADVTGAVHADGEIWSAALWNLRTAVGATATDQMVLESHFNVPCSATMNDAANEVIQADANLNAGVNEAAIRLAFCDRGILNGAECVPPSGLGLVYAISPDPAVAGQVATYTLTASNSSAATLTSVVLSATVPTGSSYVAASASDLGVESAGTVTWPAVNIAMGVQVERTFNVLVDPGPGSSILFSDDMESGTAAWVASHGTGTVDWSLSTANPHKLTEDSPPRAAKAASCIGGAADIYGCENVDLHTYLPMASIGGGAGSDGWGWTDPLTGFEYVIMGRSTGTSFVDISNPATPVYLGDLPTQTVNSDWRDVKVYGNYAFIVSEAAGHGMQVFDLTQLRNVPSPPAVFTTTVHYPGFSNAHNIWINEISGFAYAVGTSTCSGGLHMIDISNPLTPTGVGCFSADGYTHDVECVNYAGPNVAFSGKELCFASNEDTVTIVDVTNKALPVQISRSTYAGSGYTHQGALTPDHRYFLVDDELDEQNFGNNTKTFVWDMLDPANPVLVGSHLSAIAAIDHNQYIAGDLVYQANYQGGLRILKIEDLATADLCEVGYFDVYPSSDGPQFNGAWNAFPFFPSGVVAINAIEGLAIVQPQLTGVTCPAGPPAAEHSWFASDPSVLSDQYLAMANPVAITAGTELQFWHNHITEATYDGGVAEYSSNGGVSWTDLGSLITQTTYTYTGPISTSFSNPIAGRQAYEGSSGGYVQTLADLSSLAGQSIQIRFRMASDTSVSSTGWHVDDVVIGSTVSLSSAALSTGGASGSVSLVTTVAAAGANNAPVLSLNTGLVVAEGGLGVIGSSALAVTDADPSDVLTYTVTVGPSAGSLSLGASFTQAQIDGGSLSYTQNGSEVTSDSFSFTVSDGQGGTIGSTAFALTITPVNDAP
ncbi:MAG TPA: choice-of-anchor B family protein, partial [Myxococcales bacterium]|nr:choice-of-anchor B family protein [Myxococcales bacterium]